MTDVTPRPANVEAEQALLAAILVNNSAYHRVADFLRPDHFIEPVHRQIYEACGALIARGEIANPVTLHNLANQTIDAGASYLAKLAANVVTIINAPDYGRQIFDLAQRREILDMQEDLVALCNDHSLDNNAGRIIAFAEERLFDLDRQRPTRNAMMRFGDSATQAVAQAERVFQANGAVIGTPSGYKDIDKQLGGFFPGDCIVIAGRPSMGKTALATGIALGAAKQNHVVVYYSLEMMHSQLSARVLAGATGISAERQRRGPLVSSDIDKLAQASVELANLPLFIDDSPAHSVAQLRSRAVQTKTRHGLAMIVVDYLQLIVAKDAENRVQEISKITRDLKVMAQELNVPIIALSQLSRAVEARDDKRPLLSDLRESGSIEQDADIVMFCYREEAYLRREYPKIKANEAQDKFRARESDWHARMTKVKGRAEIILAKQRQGPLCEITMKFSGELTQFSDSEQLSTSEGRDAF